MKVGGQQLSGESETIYTIENCKPFLKLHSITVIRDNNKLHRITVYKFAENVFSVYVVLFL